MHASPAREALLPLTPLPWEWMLHSPGQAGRAKRPAQGVSPTQARVHNCLADLIDALMLRLDAGTKVDKLSTFSDPAPSGRTRERLTERAPSGLHPAGLARLLEALR